MDGNPQSAGVPRTNVEVVRFEGLTRRFGSQMAVNGLSLSVNEGEFFGFLGPNGAGKSTTIKMAAGLLRPTSGSISVFGLDPFVSPMEVKGRIGLVPEETALYERLTGFEALTFAGRLYGLDETTAKQRAVDLLKWLGLEEAGGKLIVDYSTGMKKKTSLGCALIHRPRLLFLDEPFSGIDPLAIKGIKNVLQHMVKEGVTIFFSSHVMELVERLCTRVAILHHGNVHAVGTLMEMRANLGLGNDATLEDIFVKAVGEPMAEEEAAWLTE
ncbi:MAG: ABC transporter ATP-binding protein [Acidobacteria bacterium]|jgi:ABC-2 type transport system ATP-binding protein|nr:ABC transporter ATP-binding protein [Acidobacteriota bacterium]